MSDDLEVILEEDPVQVEYPVDSVRRSKVPDALIYDFFERDPYTRRHRSRSMAEVPNVPTSQRGAVNSNNVVASDMAANCMKAAEV